MRHYPVFLDLTGRRCLLVGAGKVGVRKLETLLACGPGQVLVLDPGPVTADFLDITQGRPVSREQRGFATADLDGVFLVIAASGDREANREIGRLCRERGVLCNVVTEPELGSFIVPAHLELGEITVALTTGGASPALARALRRDLQTHLCSRYDALLRLLERLRPLVLTLGRPQAENAELFTRLVESEELVLTLGRGDRDESGRLLRSLLPGELHKHVEVLLDGLS